MVFIFNSLAANLRHSHVWLSFGPVLERVISSPAQHQIHHSDAPRHFDKNFGINLSLWDWMFGTLYVTQSSPEVIHYGTGEQDHERYLTMKGLIVTPFVDIARQVLAEKRPKAQADRGSDPYFSAQSASVTDTAASPQ
jgi:sterol desaturase/sphingolipid hydroxylase (fatty acid hydroxylase superfamily)